MFYSGEFSIDFCGAHVVVYPIFLQFYHKLKEYAKLSQVYITNQKPAQHKILADLLHWLGGVGVTQLQAKLFLLKFAWAKLHY